MRWLGDGRAETIQCYEEKGTQQPLQLPLSLRLLQSRSEFPCLRDCCVKRGYAESPQQRFTSSSCPAELCVDASSSSKPMTKRSLLF